MNEFLAGLGATVVGDLVNKVIAKGLSWAQNRQEPASELVGLKLGQIAERVLPNTIPEEQRPAVVTSLVEIALPTFEQIVEFSESTQRIRAKAHKGRDTSFASGPGGGWSGSGRAVTKKSPVKKAVAKKAPAKKTAAKKTAAAPNRVVKKAPVKWRNPTNSIAKKTPAKNGSKR